MQRQLSKRPLGMSGIEVSPVAMGCWPIAGVSSLDVNDADSIATLRRAFELGINFFDTAYCYGYDGESERLIAQALGVYRDQLVIATKGGLHFELDKRIAHDARPETLKRQCEQSLTRLGTDHVELFYLHAPDENVPVTESAGAVAELVGQGKARAAGASNLSFAQLQQFHAVCPLTAIQPPYNMLMREIEADVVPWCEANDVAVCVYWPLMKGLLAGKLRRDHQFDSKDGRAKYPMFQGEEYQQNMDLVDELRAIASQRDRTVAQLVVAWMIAQPGITSALCGAKRASQIEETAAAMLWELSDAEREQIDAALSRRGEAQTVSAV